jgi:hypothetical protein
MSAVSAALRRIKITTMKTMSGKPAYKVADRNFSPGHTKSQKEDRIVSRIKLHRKFGRCGIVLSVSLLILLAGCSSPNKQQVSQDFNELFSKEVARSIQPMIISVSPGEGDSDNVYEHVKFDVVAVEDTVVKKGWLAGMSLRKGQKLYGGEVIMLYQKKSGTQWKITRTDLKRAPSEQPTR